MSNPRFYDERYRRQWQNPEAILTDIGLKPGFTFIDVGCGEGFFTIPAARIVGNKGKVYGLDRDDGAIAILRQKTANADLINIDLRVGEAEETILCDRCADIVFYGIVLHDFYNPTRVLNNAKEMLKPSGLLVNLDWKKEHLALGPPFYRKISKDHAIDLIEAENFTVEVVQDIGLFHYLIIAKL